MKFAFLFLLALTSAHADDFSDRESRSYEDQKKAREAEMQKNADVLNVAIIRRMQLVEKMNGGLNDTGKCYDTDYDYAHSWKRVNWCAGSLCMPIYSRRTLAQQRWQLGFAYASIGSCKCNTANGYACKVSTYLADNDEMEPFTACYDSENRRFEDKNGKLVPYKPAPPSEPTPIPECAREVLDWMQARQQCNSIEDSSARQTCLNALGSGPAGCE
jgi:hypothetical protein